MTSEEKPRFLPISEINFENLHFSRQKKTYERKFINIFYNKKPLCLKLPKLRIPFDAQTNQYSQLEFSVSLGDNAGLIDKFKELDTEIIKAAGDNEWVNENFTYIPTLKEAKNNAFPPTIKIKIPKSREDNGIKTLFFSDKKQRIPVENNDNKTVL